MSVWLYLLIFLALDFAIGFSFLPSVGIMFILMVLIETALTSRRR